MTPRPGSIKGVSAAVLLRLESFLSLLAAALTLAITISSYPRSRKKDMHSSSYSGTMMICCRGALPLVVQRRLWSDGGRPHGIGLLGPSFWVDINEQTTDPTKDVVTGRREK